MHEAGQAPLQVGRISRLGSRAFMVFSGTVAHINFQYFWISQHGYTFLVSITVCLGPASHTSLISSSFFSLTCSDAMKLRIKADTGLATLNVYTAY